MKINIKQIISVFFIGYAMNSAMPVISADTTNSNKKTWPTWIKASIAGSLCYR